jgi:hypothetical protein
MAIGADVSLLFVTLVTGFQSVATNARGNADRAGLVDIGGGRKVYLKCQGTGSPTVTLQVGRVKRVALAEITGLVPAAKPSDALFGSAVRK